MTVAPYYDEGGITIYHGDCLEIMQSGGKTPPDEAMEFIDQGGGVKAALFCNGVDVVVTDAPYNAGFNYGTTTDDGQSWDEYAKWLGERVEIMEDLAYGPVLMFVSVRGMLALAPIRPPHWVGGWVRNGSGNPVGDNRGTLVLPTWEPCLFYGDWANEHFKGSVLDTWTTNTTAEANGHPCPKPLGLMRKMLDRLDAQSVLDPFMGSGTTLRAAKDCGMQAIGIEINEAYCEIAARRLQQEVLPL